MVGDVGLLGLYDGDLDEETEDMLLFIDRYRVLEGYEWVNDSLEGFDDEEYLKGIYLEVKEQVDIEEEELRGLTYEEFRGKVLAKEAFDALESSGERSKELWDKYLGSN